MSALREKIKILEKVGFEDRGPLVKKVINFEDCRTIWKQDLQRYTLQAVKDYAEELKDEPSYNCETGEQVFHRG